MASEHGRCSCQWFGLETVVGAPAMQQAPVCDGFPFGPLSLRQDSLAASKIDVGEGVSAKLETDVVLNFDQLYMHDLAGRAAAFQKLVAGGMDVAKAAGLSGLMAVDEST